MEEFRGSYKPTKTTEFLINLNKFVYIFGLPNFWVEDLHFPVKFLKIWDQLNKYANWSGIAMTISEYCAFFTQSNLSERQISDLIIFSMGHTFTVGFRIRIANQVVPIRNIMYKLGIGLKEVYNDSEVEDQMIRRCKFSSGALIINYVMTLFMYTLEAILAVIWSGATFNTIVTGWPDIDDRSVLGNIGKAIFNIFWWIYLTRICAVYSLVITLNIIVSHQFKNLSSYFYSLNNIFDDNNELTQRENEAAYERALKVGIKMHIETLKCINEVQTICREVFSGQIIFNIILLIVLMEQVVNSTRDLASVITLLVTAVAILLSTGFFMCNAGDITVEAALLPTAMYSSGWENCWHGSSVHVSKLLVIAMMQAQRPVVLSGLGIIALSYSSYVSIVKSSYSVFSVLY